MRLNSPRHLSKSRGSRWLAPLGAMPLSLGVAALVGILVLLAGLVAVTVAGSPAPTSRRGTGTTGSPSVTIPAPNLVADSGFDHDVAAWRPLPGAFLTRGSAAEPAEHARVQPDPSTQATTDPKTGRALYGMVLPVIRSAARGTHVDATVQIRATRSQVPVLLRLSELAGGKPAARSEVRALLTDTAWRLLKVDREVGTAGATIQVEVGALALHPDEAVFVDNVRVSSRP
jgi:hypothetical protein